MTTDDATRLETSLEKRRERHSDTGELPAIKVRYYLRENTVDVLSGDSLFQVLLNALDGSDVDPAVVEFELEGHEFRSNASRLAGQRVALRMTDGTFLAVSPGSDRGRADPPALDAGAHLLAPITGRERSAIERILSILGEAQANDDLTPWQENQIILMADLIRSARNAAVPGETERSKVVPVVGAVLAYLFLQIPDGIVKWNDAIPILHGIDWPNVAELIGG